MHACDQPTVEAIYPFDARGIANLEFLLVGFWATVSISTLATAISMTIGLILAVLALHRLTGLRGRSAARWVLAVSLVMVLAYPGVKFVSEVLLGR